MEKTKQRNNSKNDIKQEQTSSSEMNRSSIVKSFNKLPDRTPILIIRISGMVKVNKFIEETLYRLKLRRKYSATILNPTKDILGMIEKAKHYTAFGNIDKETLIKLLKARAQRIDKKQFKAEETAEELISGKSLKELGFKPFFRLHPPRGGLKSSRHPFPEGVLGNNKDINKLAGKML